MVYDSLTDIPHDFREGIDWLIALKGKGGKNMAAMGAAVYKFLADKPDDSNQLPIFLKVKLITKHFLEQPELKDLRAVELLLQNFHKPRDRNSGSFGKFFRDFDKCDDEDAVKDWGITAENIAEKLSKSVDGCEKFLKSIKMPGQYKPAYSSKATWDASCSQDPEACAAVLVGIAPMLYAGLMSLWDATDPAEFRLAPSRAKENLEKLLNALRCVKPECHDSMSRSDIVDALGGVDIDVLNTLIELSGFWEFHGLEDAEVVKANKLFSRKNGSYAVSEGIGGVDMGLLHAWNAKKSNKPPKIFTGVGSNNFHVPGAPAVANLDYGSPI
ncbi:Probable serine threonine- kinase kinX, putative [Babesia ovata]|uniref:Probable serine threonine-kinase kinX, putative n=1 Tax=Babesia ovata TaxID=189622 RepID=A0A2H6K6Y5_9APIC|nr:Probable serine threonine- kinase kinX, putative [Babesia ovata]GBE58756.1 Probable serine threonine- kinase kinX, putative [Babesia ovata]